MDWSKVFLETFNMSFSTISRMVFIVIPLLIFIELLKDTGWLEKISFYCQGITKLLKLPGEAALGVIVGFFVGLLFGSGVILQIQEEVKMTRNQLNVLFLFVGVCHAVIEETIVFTAIGAYGLVVIGSRFTMAVILSFSYMYLMKKAAWFKEKRQHTNIAG